MKTDNIPQGMRERAQWVVAKADKVPRNPHTGELASVAMPSSWSVFAAAVKAVADDPEVLHVGYVLTADDPYTIIDLDKPADANQRDRQDRIRSVFDSYTERSQSGDGYHIIVEGSVPHGCRRDRVEVYSELRYMICTGDEVDGPRPVGECQEWLAKLYAEMGPATGGAELVEVEDILTDHEVLEMGLGAANGTKFEKLTKGEWQGDYPSQSEADFALMNILCFYTKSNAQVRRIFRCSPLGRRDKAQRDSYLDYAIRKIRADQHAPEVDLENVERRMREENATRLAAAPAPADGAGLTFPPGLVGEVADYIFATSIRPVREVALAGAIAAVAGVAGRAYNASGTGLNHYIVLLAGTGSGKEGAASGIDKLFSAASAEVPGIIGFQGPGAFASGQGLARTLSENPCFVSVLGEFGLKLQQMCDPRASSAEQMVRSLLLDAYNKSGHGQTLRGHAYSKKENNIEPVTSPALTLLGEGTPESFYEGVTEDHIAEGLIPRFTVVEYTGKRVPRNHDHEAPPPPALVSKFADLAANALTHAAQNTFVRVTFDDGALVLLDAFDLEADDVINKTKHGTTTQLWNRAHVKALKLAALVAVGNDAHSPVVGRREASWAVDFVRRELVMLGARYSFAVNDETGRERTVYQLFKEWLGWDRQKRLRYKVPLKVIDRQVVPKSFLADRVARLRAFRNEKSKNSRDVLESILRGWEADEVVDPSNNIQMDLGPTSRFSGYVPGVRWESAEERFGG